VALFQAANIKDNGDGTSTLVTENFGISRNLCLEERFREQPVGAFCTGFLVAPDIIATAGHCVHAANVQDVCFVFGFEMVNQSSPRLVIGNNQIYGGAEIIGRAQVGVGPDWALVRVDRPVTDHAVLKIRTEGKINDNQAVYVIGHPSGLPKKVAGGSAVRENEAPAFFVANTDTYGGNSGSPVFNRDNHVVEGVLVRGETDFVWQGNCYVSLVCPASGCRGEDCTRTTVFASLIP
jgi:V8-like Glu-specific endopeptidase